MLAIIHNSFLFFFHHPNLLSPIIFTEIATGKKNWIQNVLTEQTWMSSSSFFS